MKILTKKETAAIVGGLDRNYLSKRKVLRELAKAREEKKKKEAEAAANQATIDAINNMNWH